MKQDEDLLALGERRKEASINHNWLMSCTMKELFLKATEERWSRDVFETWLKIKEVQNIEKTNNVRRN